MSAMAPTYEVRTGELDGFETLTLRAPGGELEATFCPRAGMVGCSLRHGGEELLHLGAGLREYVETKATMGIPLLYPWANRLAAFGYEAAGRAVSLDRASPLVQLEEHGLPIHGLLGGSPYWVAEAPHADEHGARIAALLDFRRHEDLLEAFPFPHELRLEVRLAGPGLTVATTVTPSGEVAVPVAFGFHPYLRLPGAPRREWLVELPVRERLVLDGQMVPTGEREPVSYSLEPLGERSFDDGFASLEPGRPFAAEAAGRRIEATFGERYPFAQVFTPAGAQFVCFEPMTAPANALRSGDGLKLVAPGERFEAEWRLTVEAA